MSVYGRLNYTPGFADFNGADQLTQNTVNFISNTSINLSQWQIDDMANNVVGGYYQNPHQYVLATISLYLTGLYSFSNTQIITYTNAPDSANNLANVISAAGSSLITFTTHTNNLSGVTTSSNTAVYPDLNSALAVGRQILNITNKTDSVQNNTPIMGSFTSLYVGNNLTSLQNSLINDYITLTNSMDLANTSNISNAAMNVIISDVTTLQTLIDTQKNGDIGFYQNSLSVMKDYQTLLQFSNMGATQNSLIKLIGTPKLHSGLGY